MARMSLLSCEHFVNIIRVAQMTLLGCLRYPISRLFKQTRIHSNIWVFFPITRPAIHQALTICPRRRIYYRIPRITAPHLFRPNTAGPVDV
jgi:hypothetical protein